jgi:CubicO group peptidase (beta-lactamase class C family)
MVQFSSTTLNTLRQTVDAACADQKSGIPGSTVVVVGRNGEELFAHCAGKRGVSSNEPMDQDNIYWIASCTKMVVGVACMQLVERGVLALDDSKQLEGLCPELKTVGVLQDNGTLTEKKRGITLRMLLTHTGTWHTLLLHDLIFLTFKSGIRLYLLQ